jgi:hypothetical protein
LQQAGFDVARLYRGALLTANREAEPDLRAALARVPGRPGADGLARLARRGVEDWARRTRAIPGYADTARAAGLPRLLEIAKRAKDAEQAEAIDAIGQLLEDHGHDPCIPGEHWGFGRGSSALPRDVGNVMTECATRVDALTVRKVVTALSPLAASPSPVVRETLAEALGRMAAVVGRPALGVLAKDTFGSGEICTSTDSGKDKCEPNRPVRRAATEALEAIARAEQVRAEQRKQAASGAGPAP